MKPSVLPISVDRMPREAREPSADPFYTPRFLIAVALSAIPFRWSGRALSEDSIPVNQVLDALRLGGYKVVPMTREDYEGGE